MAGLHISKAAKNGFLRIFSPHSRRIAPLTDKEAWKQNGEALRNDWRIIGNEIRSASRSAASR